MKKKLLKIQYLKAIHMETMIGQKKWLKILDSDKPYEEWADREMVADPIFPHFQ